MTLVGVHLHGPDRTDINDLLTERYRVYLMLADERGHYLGTLVSEHRRRGWPDPRIVIRQHQVPQLRGYHEWRDGGDWQREVESHADNAIALAGEINSAFGIWPELIPWNEPNLPLEQSGGPSREQFEYCDMAFPLYYRRVKAACPEVLVHFPAWSPGNREDDDRFISSEAQRAQGMETVIWGYDGISICARSIELADIVDIHAYMGGTWAPGYWTTQRVLRPVGFRDQYDLGGMATRFPHKIYALTEWNAENPYSNEAYWRDRYVDFHVALYAGLPHLEYSTYYTWADDDREQQSWELFRSDTLRSALRRIDLYIRQHPKQEEETPMPTDTWDAVWAEHEGNLAAAPMFAKVAAEAALGDADQPVAGRQYRWQSYAGGLVYAPVGDWANTRVARSRAELPQ